MQKHTGHKRAFTLIELLIVIAVVAVLVAIAVPVMAGVRERSRRVVCMGTMRSFHVALTAYAANHNELLPKGGMSEEDNLITMEPEIYESLNAGFLCPNLYNPFRGQSANLFDGGSYQSDHTYYLLAYCYLGGFADTPWALTDPVASTWKSPCKTTDSPRMPILTEMNTWTVQFSITFAPHGQNGPIHESGDSTNKSRNGISSDEIGAVGGNVCALDGAILWKAIEEMAIHMASADPVDLQALW